MTSRSYAFGDSEAAAQRLALVAEVFEAPSRAFLSEFQRGDIQLAVDLGCGPGFTTQLVREVMKPRRVVGLDNSDAFLELARRNKSSSEISFIKHDVTKVPFPVEAVDLIYCRYLVTHLQDHEATLRRWATQLRPGGLLMLDEVESIETSNPAFANYLEVVARLLDRRGSRLLIGPDLDAVILPDTKRLSSRVRDHRVDPRSAAKMFRLNLENWRDDPHLTEEERAGLPQLAAELKRISARGADQKIVWGLRQIAFRKN